MSIIVMPGSPVAAEVRWSLRQPTQVNRSEWTGRRKVTVLAGAPRWSASVAFPTILGEAAILPWRAFFARTQGQANSFRLQASERVQLTGVAPLVNGGGQFGMSLATDGWGTAGLKLRAGQFVTINDQLLQLTADVVASAGGAATIQFLPHIRLVPADNAPIIVERPTGLMAMTEDASGWMVSRGQQYSISFDCEEAF